MIWHENIFATHFEEQPVALPPFKWPGDDYIGCALPHRKALGKTVVIEYLSKVVSALVVDIGPHTIDDTEYVFGSARPRAEIYKGKFCPISKTSNLKPSIPDGKGGYREIDVSNGAGIDLMPGLARELGIKINENVYVNWVFEENLH